MNVTHVLSSSTIFSTNTPINLFIHTQREYSFTQSIYPVTPINLFIHTQTVHTHNETNHMEPSNKPTRIYPDRQQSTQPIHPSIQSFTQGDHETIHTRKETIRHTNQSIQSHNGTRQTGAEGRWTTAVTPR